MIALLQLKKKKKTMTVEVMQVVLEIAWKMVPM